MIDCIIAFDEKDVELGGYFESCKEQIRLVLSENESVMVQEINAQRCNQPFLEHVLSPKLGKPFLFAAYCHGLPNALKVEGEQFIKSNENTSLFQNVFFYTNACLAGETLGKELMEKGALAFIGYNDTIKVDLRAKNIFRDCDNYTLMFFVGTNVSIYEAFKAAKKYFTFQIDKLIESGGWKKYDAAAELTFARDSLVFLGNKELKFTQLLT